MRRKNDTAVSTVVGELLMVSVVLVMVGVLVLQSGMIIPPGRTPVVTILMNATPGSNNGGSVMLWHKGGDYVEISTMKVSVGTTVYTPGNFTVYSRNGRIANRIFDLGGRIEVSSVPVKNGDMVRLFTPETVLFSGTVGP